MKRKLLTILICCVLAVTLAFSLASCGDNQDNKETQSTESNKTINSTNSNDKTNKETDCTHVWKEQLASLPRPVRSAKQPRAKHLDTIPRRMTAIA